MKTHTLLLLIILTLLLSCNKSKSSKSLGIELKYGVAFNPVRQIIGLEPMDKNWGFHRTKFKHIVHPNLLRIDWYNKNIIPNKIITKPRYIYKSVFTEFGTIIWETDSYISSEQFKSTNQRGKEIRINKTLTYRYRFEPDNFYEKGWDYYFSTNEKISGFISKQQADSVLHSWGLTRTQ